MNRRAFLGFMRSAPIAGVGAIASVATPPVRADDLDGFVIDANGGLTITNCTFNASPNSDRAVLEIRQKS